MKGIEFDPFLTYPKVYPEFRMFLGIQVTVSSAKQNDRDYISLTDMAKYKTYLSGTVISNWRTTKYTIQFMGAWEQLHNPNFNVMEFHNIKNDAASWLQFITN